MTNKEGNMKFDSNSNKQFIESDLIEISSYFGTST